MNKFLKSIIHKKLIVLCLFGLLFYLIHFLLYLIFKIKPSIIIWSDAEGYYQYLPQLFYHNNLKALPYAVTITEGITFNKYTCGTAILQAPFFFLAHIYCKIFAHPCNGYSIYYAIFIWIAAVTYAYIALVILYKILRKWFRKMTSFIAVLFVYCGTNLFYYTHCNPGYSHVYSFFILTFFVYRLGFFLNKTNFKNALFCAIPLGLSLLIRPTNVFYLLLFFLYEVYSVGDISKRINWIFKNLKYFIAICLIIFLIFIPQMLYWYAVSGKFFIYAYKYSALGPETFDYWKKPRIGEVIFGVENGWLIYSPFFFLFIIGLIYSLIKKKAQSLAILIIFFLILYVNASWWAYTFLCGFGYRAFIEYYPLLIIPIAYLIEKTFEYKRKFALFVIMFFMIILSFTNFRWSQFFYVEQCWLKSDGWNWISYNRAWNKAFFIIPQNRNLK